MAMQHPVEILLVEDDPDHVELALRALKKNNLANKVQVARDGEEALDFIFGQGKFEGRNVNDKPKLVLLDLKLPKVDGLEVLRKIREDKRTQYMPVVILTCSQQEQDIVESYELGVNSYIVKPVDFDKFVRAISELGFYWIVLNQPPC
jgi:CheY-like chemotaxis protein